MKAFYSLLLVFIAFSCLTMNAFSQLPDYYILAQTWGNSLCSTKRCRPGIIPQNFTIHGLWPDMYSGPLNCRSGYPHIQDYNRVCQAFLPLMNAFWPGLTFVSNQAFWGYQWRKHGVCSPFHPTFYFRSAIDLKISLSPHNLLAAKQIIPSSGSSYGVAAIKAAIKVKTRGNRIALRCVTKNRQSYLSEVYACFELKKGSAFIQRRPQTMHGEVLWYGSRFDAPACAAEFPHVWTVLN